MTATLYIIATPIGNLEDISYRAIRILGECEALACEDTRQTRKILDHYNIPIPKYFISYHAHNEFAAGNRILGLLQQGLSVGLCSDAGTPGISDPGYRVTKLALESGFHIESIPGPNAVTNALILSGLPTSSYLFLGFPPNKPGKRRNFLNTQKDISHTLVFYESPLRINKLLIDILEVLGNRQIAVCLEMTKKFERVERGFVSDIINNMGTEPPKGEITVVVAGLHHKFIKEENDETPSIEE